MSILSKVTYRFNAIPFKIPMAFFTVIEKEILKFLLWNHKWLWIAKTVLKKNNKAGGSIILDLKLYDKAVVVKKYGICIRADTYINGTESAEVSLYMYIYRQLIFNKGTENIQWGKDSFFNKWHWENWKSICKRMKLDPYPTPYTEINSKWIKLESKI